jgi:hypothetical protein
MPDSAPHQVLLPAPPPKLKTAPEVYALSQGGRCQGPLECHYCAAPCDATYRHGEFIPPLMGRPTGPGHRARPGNQHICVGCWLWRRGRVTAPFLSGGLKDGVAPKSQDWLITSNIAKAISPDCKAKLLAALLSPPLKFALVLSEKVKRDNSLQCCPANDHDVIRADTELRFTIDDVTFTYTVYDLEQAAKGTVQGRGAGARELIRLLGPVPSGLISHVARTPDPNDEGPRGKGRPPVPPPDPRVGEQQRPVVVSGGGKQGRRAA